MYICVPCKCVMRCEKNGVGARWGKSHVYASDCFKCPACGHEILSCTARPVFDPDGTFQDEYLDMPANEVSRETSDEY